MKKAIFIFFQLFVSYQLVAQNTFLKQIDGNLIRPNEIVSFNDKSFFLGPSQLIKMDSLGTILWVKELQSPDSISIDEEFLKTKDGNLLMEHLGNIISTDTSGLELWSRKYSRSNGENFGGLKIESSDKGLLMLSGNLDSIWSGILLLKTDSAGNPQWCKTYNVDTMAIFPKTVIETEDGGFLLAGECNFSVWPYYRIITIKVDESGNVLHAFITRMGESHYGKFFKVADNKYFLPGDGTFMCFDSTGSLVWNKMQTFGYWRGGIVTRNNHLFFTGEAWDTLHTYLYSNCTAEIDTGGNIIQCVRYTDYDSIGMYLIDTLNGGGFISFGGIFGGHPIILRNDSAYSSPCYNYHLNIFDSLLSDSSAPLTIHSHSDSVMIQNSTITFTSTTMTNSVICDQWSMIPTHSRNIEGFLISPNPASSIFKLTANEYFLNEEVKIYNLLGNRLFSSTFCGPLTVDCRLFPPGLYFVKLQTDPDSYREGTSVQKLIIQ